MAQIHPDVVKVLYDAGQIHQIVKGLASRINDDYRGRKLLVITILKGAGVFMADLVRELEVEVELEFMVISSYGSSAESSGVVKIVKDVDTDIAGRDVLVVEDILDTGLTLQHLVKELESRNPASVELAVLMRKDLGKQAAVRPRYLGFVCPDEFIVGYGLDYGQRYRNLPYIGVLDPKVYS